MIKWLIAFNSIVVILLLVCHLGRIKKAKLIPGADQALLSAERMRWRDDAYKAALKDLRMQAVQAGHAEASAEVLESSVLSASGERIPGATQKELLETLIHFYRRESAKHQIFFSARGPELVSDELIRDYHLIHIIGNLLQNALEAELRQGAKRHRRIELKIECSSEVLTVQVFNSYAKAEGERLLLSQWTAPGYSTKDAAGSGNGLALIQRLVNEKDGILYLDDSEGILLVTEFSL